MNEHYLILEWAEDPADPKWDDLLDWHISHPPDCEWVIYDEDHHLGRFQCGFDWEIENCGVDAFGATQERINNFPSTPAAVVIEQFTDKTFVSNGSHYGWEFFSQIIPKEEVK